MIWYDLPVEMDEYSTMPENYPRNLDQQNYHLGEMLLSCREDSSFLSVELIQGRLQVAILVIGSLS